MCHETKQGQSMFNHRCWVPPMPELFLHRLIQWIPLFEIMKFIHAYFKTFKNQGRCEKCLPKRKWEQILLKMEFL